jgi:S-adenosylmethionine-diacylgycerolhomoserine-N-methlytransferase
LECSAAYKGDPLNEQTLGGHAALMDQVYRRQRFIYDLTRKYYLFGRDRVIRELDLKPGQRLVEVGCGTARNLVHIARRYPKAKLFGLDASAEMLKTASGSLARAGVTDSVTLAQGYAEALSPAMFGETEPFDAVLFSYSLSMIPDWQGSLGAAKSALAASGTVWIVDFGDLKGLGPWGERLLRFWLSLFHVSPREELVEVLDRHGGHGIDSSLRLLPGRYAFVLRLPKQGLAGLSFPVARESQGSSKSL